MSALAGGPGGVAGALGLVQDDDAEGRVPEAELAQPLAQHSGGAHDDGGAEAAAVVQARQEHCQLHRLAQAHLVADDAPRPLRVQLPQPLHTCSHTQPVLKNPSTLQCQSRHVRGPLCES